MAWYHTVLTYAFGFFVAFTVLRAMWPALDKLINKKKPQEKEEEWKEH